MIIGIDGNEANVERLVGIGEYAFQTLSFFHLFKKEEKTTADFFIYLKDEPLAHMPKEIKGWKYVVVKPKKMWTQIGLPWYLFTHFPKPDIFFTPSHYAPRFSPVPTAIAIMDAAYLHFPELFAQRDLYQLKNWTAYSAHKAAKIFTISESSKRDIIKEYKKHSGDVVVTYPGIKVKSQKSKVKTMEELQEKFGLSKQYLLFVGTLQPRKNIARLIESFGIVVRSKQKVVSDLELVIVGKKGWLYEEILAAPEKFHVADKVKFLDFVSDEDLPSLYEHALCYVLPSLYEGFGLPVLEAMKYGCPVITSNISSLPEAGGDAAVYVDPNDPKDIAEKIEKVISSEKLREELREKGYKHIKKFSWEKAAKETLEELEKVASKQVVSS